MPPLGIAAAPLSFLGFFCYHSSVVIRSPAIDAAFCRAPRPKPLSFGPCRSGGTNGIITPTPPWREVREHLAVRSSGLLGRGVIFCDSRDSLADLAIQIVDFSAVTDRKVDDSVTADAST